VADARRRHLKDGGVIVPRRISQLVAPVVADRIHRELCAWDDVGHGLDLSPAKRMSLNNIYVRTLAPKELLGGDAAFLRLGGDEPLGDQLVEHLAADLVLVLADA